MKTQEARNLGDRLASLVSSGENTNADKLLLPLLSAKTSFPLLDVIGLRLGTGLMEPVNLYLEGLSKYKTMGGWVVIASALRSQLAVNFPGAIYQSVKYTRLSSTWYGVDIFGERVPGPALVMDINTTLEIIRPWRNDDDRWIRRMVGVAVHYWAKAAHGTARLEREVGILLEFLSPMFTERNYDAVKGVGWGLKTLGRFYPAILTDWLVFQKNQPHTALMMRKAVTFLPPEMKVRVLQKSE